MINLLDWVFPSRVKNRMERENQVRRENELLEEIRFQKFIDDKKQREDLKHPNSKVAEGVSKCRVGAYWTGADYIDLISAIKPGVSLEKLSKATGRSYIGILNRLRILKLIRRGNGFTDVWKPYIHKPSGVLFTMDGKQIDVKKLLISVGYIEKGNRLICPEWLSQKEIK